ncbi:RNA-binding protein [Pseudoalteromonas sp. Scap03]|uniref:RNA-binding protein n=1 Tax=unclassified Pseudoalteromonas TaxID=194690 RepID=UPI0015BDEE27|nr:MULTISPECIES: RNA-binding protein [unclassified Pseudoalteromonas]NWL14936.1 RNA-binding protein [Pseudoalteromonas sp. Scap03]QLE80069.1 RNA-binding protein [Pseudoalteromonas sp. Scap25]QLE88011.1 RNA-binding protein [Pseudoalteromonas sp. Scap06]
MAKLILLLCCLGACTVSMANEVTVFKCTIKGVPTFSQTPCAKDAKVITLKNVNIMQTNALQSENALVIDTSVDDYLEVQQIERDIVQLELKIKQYQQEYAQKKQQVGYMTQDKANRLGADSIADAIATETAVLKQRFEPQIKQAQQQIAALTQKKQQLNQQP